MTKNEDVVTFSVLCCDALNFAWMIFVKGIPSLKYSRHSRRISISLLHALKSPAWKKSFVACVEKSCMEEELIAEKLKKCPCYCTRILGK